MALAHHASRVLGAPQGPFAPAGGLDLVHAAGRRAPDRSGAGCVGVRHGAREEGTSSYNLIKLIRYNFDLFANFSRAPLEFLTFSGLLLSVCSFILFIVLLIDRIVNGPDVQGVFTLFAIQFFFTGILLMGLGIVGEYIGRIYEEVRRRPRFIIRDVLEAKAPKRK